MEYAIMGIAFGLVFFLIPLMAYRKGIQDGLDVGKGKSLEPIKGPIAAIQEHKEIKTTKAQEDKIAEGIANIFSYDGKPRGGEKD
jgi:hypothetical protein